MKNLYYFILNLDFVRIILVSPYHYYTRAPLTYGLAALMIGVLAALLLHRRTTILKGWKSALGGLLIAHLSIGLCLMAYYVLYRQLPQYSSAKNEPVLTEAVKPAGAEKGVPTDDIYSCIGKGKDACYEAGKAACDAGRKEGCNRLAQEEMIRGNSRAAESIYRRLCEQDAEWCGGLAGVLSQTGRKPESHQILRRMCLEGHNFNSCMRTAESMDLAREGPEFRERCKNKDAYACSALAYAEQAHGDIKRALVHFDWLCKEGLKGNYFQSSVCRDGELANLGPEQHKILYSIETSPYWEDKPRSPNDQLLLKVDRDCYEWMYLLPEAKSKMINQDMLRHIITASLAADFEIKADIRPGDRSMPTTPPKMQDILAVPTIREWLGPKTADLLLHDKVYIREYWRMTPTRSLVIDRLSEQFGIYLVAPQGECGEGH